MGSLAILVRHAAFLTLLASLGCAGQRVVNTPPAPAQVTLVDAYRAAIVDAAVYRPENVRHLNVIRRGVDSVSVVIWTPARYRGTYPKVT